MTPLSSIRQFWAGVCAIPEVAQFTRDTMAAANTGAIHVCNSLSAQLNDARSELAAEREAHAETKGKLELCDSARLLSKGAYEICEKQLTSARTDLDALKAALNRDRTGLALGLEKVMKIVRGYSWIGDGEWGSYDSEQQTEQTLRIEIERCLHQVHEVAYGSLLESGRLVDAVFNTPESLAEWKAREGGSGEQ